MRLLLDTHALLWWFAGNVRLSRKAADAIGRQDSVVFVSAASAWEIATKVRLGKLPSAVAFVAGFREYLEQQNFSELAVSVAHGRTAGSLPGDHPDPFDRMLIAQAQAEDLLLISNETLFDSYGVRRLW
ncbi:MAG TPA: type II toxin-antitoxin system VapC family toxin [Alphaproteobacteria bacterium]|nr:type II toxin-antitoxin system VapC family toxin [Alphaproteobacteria bacterium]